MCTFMIMLLTVLKSKTCLALLTRTRHQSPHNITIIIFITTTSRAVVPGSSHGFRGMCVLPTSKHVAMHLSMQLRRKIRLRHLSIAPSQTHGRCDTNIIHGTEVQAISTHFAGPSGIQSSMHPFITISRLSSCVSPQNGNRVGFFFLPDLLRRMSVQILLRYINFRSSSSLDDVLHTGDNEEKVELLQGMHILERRSFV